MPVATVYLHGGKAGVPPGKNDHMRAVRGDVEGWSEGATRRNTQFLMSIREPDLTGAGVTFTLTLRDCPPTPELWHKLRKAWSERMRRAGMIRVHWVTEWQRRGVPHLHGVIWFPDKFDMATPVGAWIDLAGVYGATLRGQHARPLESALGWFKYLSKHAARGVKHYQRTAENVPKEWQSKTGRVWGYGGSWPLETPRRIALDDAGFFALRRLVRSWRIADARAEKSSYRIRSARTMLRANDPQLSRLRGYSEWMPSYGVQLRLMASLADRGFTLCYADTGETLAGESAE